MQRREALETRARSSDLEKRVAKLSGGSSAGLWQACYLLLLPRAPVNEEGRGRSFVCDENRASVARSQGPNRTRPCLGAARQERALDTASSAGFFSARTFGVSLLPAAASDDSGDPKAADKGLLSLGPIGGWFAKGQGVEV